MKKTVLLIPILLLSAYLIAAQSGPSASCVFEGELINQDPYPAVPGESVKVVFQITGVEDGTCGILRAQVIQKFPFSVDPESTGFIEIISGTFVRDFKSNLLLPVKLRVDKDALDGDNQIDLAITSAQSSVLESFQINVEDLRTDFEVSIKDYDPDQGVITFEILNTGEHDVEALTIDITSQDNIQVKGSTRNIIGSLDSNDDTTFTFEGAPKTGEINLIITYTDEINERRTLSRLVSFDEDNFKGRGPDQGLSMWFYVTLVIVLLLVYRWWRNRNRHSRSRHPHPR